MSTQQPAMREVAGYTILRELGRGGAGTVYLAVQEALDRKVALKVLHREMAEDDVYLQRFFREAKAAAIFQHPNVVAVHDAGECQSSGDYFIAFEYIEGDSLEGLLEDGGKLTETRALEITKAVAQALFFAESKNIIHRDVKPANILIGKDNTVKLADLGLAKKTDPEAPKVTVEGLIVGTPYYMAPEQALGRVDIDNRVDIYSLGLCLWCMLTGRTPYLETKEENSTVIHVLSRRLTEELPNVRDVEAEVSAPTAQLISDMTARKRENRYRSAADVVRDIDRILSEREPLGPDGVEPRLSDLPTTSVDATQLQAAIQASSPSGADETMAAARPASPSDSSASGELPPGEQASAAPAATAPAAVSQSQARRAAALLAQSSEELQAIRQRPVLLAILLAAMVAGVGLGGLAVYLAEKPADVAGASSSTAQESPLGEPVQREDPPLPPVEESPAPTETTPLASPSAVATTSPLPTRTVPRPSPSPRATPSVSARPTPSPSASEAPADADHINDDPTELTPQRAAEISAALFTSPPHGARLLQLLVEGDQWQGLRPGRRFVAVMLAARDLLESSQPWPEREKALDRLDETLRDFMDDARALDGELGAAVATELNAWAGFAKGIRILRQSIADPRLRKQALHELRKVPARLDIGDSAEQFLGLIDRVDGHQRWLRLDSVRADLLPHQRKVAQRLEHNAVGVLLREEVLAVCASLEQLVLDSESCLVAALCHPAVAALPPSSFLASRLQEVPHNASLSNMPGWGIRIDLAAPPREGDEISLKVDDLQVTLTRDVATLGPQTQAISWRGSTRVYAALRSHQLLVRAVGAQPSNLTFTIDPERPPAAARYTLRTRGQLELRKVELVQIPEAYRLHRQSSRGEGVRRTLQDQ